MSPFMKRMIIIALWIPLAAYAAHEWSGTVGRSAAAMPSSRVPDRDNAGKSKAATKNRADVAKSEVQASVSFGGVKSGQFKEALAEREWAMKNAQPFFGGANFANNNPVFGGAFGPKFAPLFNDVKKLVECEKEFEAWYGRPVQLPASSALRAFDDDILKPFNDSRAPRDMLDKYSLRGRYRVLNAFAKQLAEDYDKRLADSKTLPVERSDEMLKQIEAILKLHAECNGIDAPSVKVDTARDEQDWKARLELLKLFAKDPESLSPADTTVWFEDVNKYHGNLKDASTKRLIREKVQQFCGQYVPRKLALDDFIFILKNANGKVAKVPVARKKGIRARYDLPGGKTEDYDLTADPDGLNEVTADPEGKNDVTASIKKKYMAALRTPPDAPPASRFSLYAMPDGGTQDPKLVEPTPLSVAAFEYFKARQDVPSMNGWTRKTIDELIKKAGPAGADGEHIWNKLSRLVVAGEYKVYDRLKIVDEAIRKFTALFPE